MLFGSKASAFQVIVKDATPIYDHGTLIGHTKEITAEFATFSPEAPVVDEDGEPALDDRGQTRVHAFILGHCIDTEEQAKRKGWTDEERVLVEKKLQHICSIMPGECWEISRPVPSPPWPTYEAMHHNEVPTMAEKMGLVGEALYYEQVRPDGTRPSIIEKLQAAQERQGQEQELTAAV